MLPFIIFKIDFAKNFDEIVDVGVLSASGRNAQPIVDKKLFDEI